MNCKCTAVIRYEADTMKTILEKFQYCSLHSSAPAMLEALKRCYDHLAECSHFVSDELWNAVEQAVKAAETEK